jgi:hypothetical protein
MSKQAVSADTIPNSAVGIFYLKTGGTKTKAARVLIRRLPHNLKAYILPTYSNFKIQQYSYVDNLLKVTTETESEVAEKSSWD